MVCTVGQACTWVSMLSLLQTDGLHSGSGMHMGQYAVTLTATFFIFQVFNLQTVFVERIMSIKQGMSVACNLDSVIQ